MKKVKLFCLPYAGGSAMIYTKWRTHLHNMIDLCPLEMSGRGKRFNDILYDNIEDAVSDLFKIVIGELDGTDYAFFGHSMGTLIIYELMKKIKNKGYKDPIHLFLSGGFPPHIEEQKKIHNLTDKEFKTEIEKLGGMPKELLVNQDFLEIFLPILRADYKMLETYKFSQSDKLWDSNISVLYGKNDLVVQNYNIFAWKSYTNRESNFFEFDGGHFFIHNFTEKIVELINQILFKKQSTTLN